MDEGLIVYYAGVRVRETSDRRLDGLVDVSREISPFVSLIFWSLRLAF